MGNIILQMEATFNEWTLTGDFAFAVAKCPRTCGPKRQCDEETSFYLIDDPSDSTSISGCDENSLSSTSSVLSVKFADNVVSDIITVPRYADKHNVGDFFYSVIDLARFREEFKMERMRWWERYTGN